MADPIDLVNGMSRQLRHWAANSKPEVAEMCLTFAKTVEALAKEVTDLRNLVAPLPTRLGDLSDLPTELRKELSGIEIDELETQLVAVINAYGGTADINQVLVGLYRKFKVMQTRRFVQQKLWRMTADNLIWSVPKRKGVYSTRDPGKVPPAKTAGQATFGNARDFASFESAQQATSQQEEDDEIPF